MSVLDAVERLPGWFQAVDRLLFDWTLRDQQAQGARGDLLEIGAYKGKSAVLLGAHLRSGETFTVCDVFDTPPDQVAGESATYYNDLGRAEFEANYRTVHPTLPTIIHDSSLTIREHVTDGSCRFVHVDGSHLYPFAQADIDSAMHLLGPHGVVVIDDYTSEHTPGVAAAAWERTDMTVLFLSSFKMYACWDEPPGIVDRLLSWAQAQPLGVDVQPIRGRQVPLLSYREGEPSIGRKIRSRLHRMIG